MNHRQMRVTERARAACTAIEAFFGTIGELAQWKEEVADTTPAHLTLAGDGTIMLEYGVQRVDERPDVSADIRSVG